MEHGMTGIKMSRRFVHSVLAAAALSAAATCANGATPSFQGLGDFPGGNTVSAANGVSADGSTVVGLGTSAASSPSGEAFRWTSAGGMQSLGNLGGGAFGNAIGVSGNGSTIVGSSLSPSGEEAFRWTSAGGMQGLGDLTGGAFLSVAWGISSDGTTVVGRGSSAASSSEAFRWSSAGGLQAMGDLAGGAFGSRALAASSNGSIIVGEGTSASGQEAFRWTSAGGMQGMGDLSGGFFQSAANGISDDGLTIVGYGSSASGREAMRWTSGGGMQGLGDFAGGSFQSEAYAASPDGSIIVGNGTIASGQVAFVWDSANGMRNFRDVLVNEYGLNLTGWTLLLARDVSADGTVFAGIGTNPSGQTEAWRAVLAADAWAVNSNGNWSVVGNWFGGVPNASGAEANFRGAITAPRTVTVDSPKTVGTINFDNANAYTIAGPGALTIQGSGINVASGSHTISAPLSFASNTGIAIIPAASVLTISSAMSVNAVTVTQSGAGTLAATGGLTINAGGTYTLSGGALTAPTLICRGSFNYNAGTMNVSNVQLNDGGTMNLSAGQDKTLKVATLSIDTVDGSKLELKDNRLIVTAGGVGSWNGSAYTGVTGLIQSGRGDGTWNGSGLITSMSDALILRTTIAVAAAGEALGLAPTETSMWGGQQITGNDTLVMYTYAGDLNVDGTVNADDYAYIDLYAHTPGARGYGHGDINYDGSINADDYALIDINVIRQGDPFQTRPINAAASSLIAVPEPGLGLAGIALLPLMRRRRGGAFRRAKTN
jgi:uncharacterized membrane protein